MINKKHTSLLPVKVVSVLSKYVNHHSSWCGSFICYNNENGFMNGRRLAGIHCIDIHIALTLCKSEKCSACNGIYLKTKESSKANLQYRPDGCMVLNEQLNDVYALGFCKVKSIDAINRHNLTHTDTFRLTMFAKSTIDDNEIKCILAVHSVGTDITFFLCSLQAEAVYPFIKLERITIPTSIDDLPDFIAHLDTCKQIISTYNKFCVPLGREERANLRRQSLTQQQVDGMVTEHRAGESPSTMYK